MQQDFVKGSKGIAGAILLALIGVTWTGSAQSVRDEASDVGALRAEVRRLALEVLDCRAELVQWKVQVISSELAQVQAERQRITGDRQLIEREIGDLGQGSANGASGEDEGRREELNTAHLPALLETERAASQREASLTAALGAENARMTEMRKQAERLTAQPANPR